MRNYEGGCAPLSYLSLRWNYNKLIYSDIRTRFNFDTHILSCLFVSLIGHRQYLILSATLAGFLKNMSANIAKDKNVSVDAMHQLMFSRHRHFPMLKLSQGSICLSSLQRR